MASPYLERLREVLWPTSNGQPAGDVYALLDAARDVRIYHTLRRSLVDSCCLYAGELPRALAEAAPYLVTLGQESEFTARLIDLVWGNSAAVFVTSTAILPDLRRHFRRFLRVQDEQGRGMIFRYYDPRVLRAYLPTCSAEELRFVFGPVERFVVEGPSPGQVVDFCRVGQGLARQAIEMTGLGGARGDAPRDGAVADRA